MKREDLEAWIKNHEGYSPIVYLDTDDPPNPTLGWGHNGKEPIPVEASQLIFNDDLSVAESALSDQAFYINQPEGVQCALIDMCFTMGIEELLKFTDMIAALNAKNYTQAALEVLNSVWATRAPNRSKDVSLVIRQGQ